MSEFSTIEDLEAWLEPMDYRGFWYAMAPYGLRIEDKTHCDAQITEGAPEETVLYVLKGLARNELADKFKLGLRPVGPGLRVIGSH